MAAQLNEDAKVTSDDSSVMSTPLRYFVAIACCGDTTNGPKVGRDVCDFLENLIFLLRSLNLRCFSSKHMLTAVPGFQKCCLSRIVSASVSTGQRRSQKQKSVVELRG